MAFLKTRPDLTLRLPPRILPGDQVEAELVILCEKPLPITFVVVEIEGTERVPQYRTRVLSLRAELETHTELPAGSTSLPFRFTMPSHVPPSYDGQTARIHYQATAHVAIPWWPDRRQSFRINVLSRPVPQDASEPKIYSSNTSRTGAHIELSLARDWARVGGIVSGAFSIMDMDVQNITSISVQLRPIENITVQERSWSVTLPSFRIKIDRENLIANEMVPFEFSVPTEVHPSFEPTQPPGMCGLSWKLALEIERLRGGKTGVIVPFRILPFKAGARMTQRAQVPTVGSDRLGRIWTSVGNERNLRHDAQALVGERAGCDFEIRRLHQDERVFVVAAVRYPHLNLALDVKPASDFRRLVGGGLRVDNREWDRGHMATARDQTQGRHVLKPLVAALASGLHIHEMDDECLVLRAENNGTDHESLLGLVDRMLWAIDALNSVRSNIPPPETLGPIVKEWTQVARTLGGTVENARMRIDLSLTKAFGHVGVVFDADGTPHCIEIAVRPNQPLEVKAWAITPTDRNVEQTLTQHIQGELRHYCRKAATGSLRLSIAPDALKLHLPLDPAQEVLFSEEAKGARDIPGQLSRLLRIMEGLRANAGPYR